MWFLTWLGENRLEIYRMLLLRILVTLLIATATYIYTREHGFTESIWEKIGMGFLILAIVAGLTFAEAHRKHTARRA